MHGEQPVHTDVRAHTHGTTSGSDRHHAHEQGAEVDAPGLADSHPQAQQLICPPPRRRCPACLPRRGAVRWGRAETPLGTQQGKTSPPGPRHKAPSPTPSPFFGGHAGWAWEHRQGIAGGLGPVTQFCQPCFGQRSSRGPPHQQPGSQQHPGSSQTPSSPLQGSWGTQHTSRHCPTGSRGARMPGGTVLGVSRAVPGPEHPRSGSLLSPGISGRLFLTSWHPHACPAMPATLDHRPPLLSAARCPHHLPLPPPHCAHCPGAPAPNIPMMATTSASMWPLDILSRPA